MSFKYDLIESIFANLNTFLKDDFSVSETLEMQSFIDVGEYGLAAETVVDIILEEKKQVSSKAYEAICTLHNLMKMDCHLTIDSVVKDN